jgi:glycerol-3-phosphate acyltransferase PlsX
MRIAIDAMGGDFAPLPNVEGVKLALAELPDDTTILMVGDEEILEKASDETELSDPRVEIYHAPDTIAMGVHPTKALSRHPEASIPVGYRLLKNKEIDGFSSCGNTGAMHVGALFSIKAIEGIIRPSLASIIPKENGGNGIMLDIGANADCRPDVLVQFAELGSLYAKHVLDIANPKVGLVNLGEEETKGTLLTQSAHQLMKINSKISFVGNLEGKDIFNERADVVVCDGFTGNVLLKFAESIYTMLKQRDFSDPFFDRMDYKRIGGSPILGINGNVTIGHGVSDKYAIKSMLIQSYKMAESKINEKIKESLMA